MKALSIFALTAPLVLACSGGGGGGGGTSSTSNNAPNIPGAFSIETALNEQPASQITSSSLKLASGAIVQPLVSSTPIKADQIEFRFSISAHEGGSLVAGNSATTKTVQYLLTTTGNVGSDSKGNPVTGAVGATSASSGGYVNEVFSSADPSVVITSGSPAGYLINPTVGLGEFMVRVRKNKPTKMDADPILNGPPPSSVNEVVIRLSHPGIDLLDSNSNYVGHLVTSPHFVYNNGANLVLLTNDNGSSGITIAGQPAYLNRLQYIFFMPKSALGPNAKSFYVYGGSSGNTVVNPLDNLVLGGDPYVQGTPKDIATWIMEPGNTGLVDVIIKLIGKTPADPTSDPEFMAKAQYFENFFVRYFLACSVMFRTDANGGYLGDNQSTSAAFEIIPLDDTNEPIQMKGNSVLNFSYYSNPNDTLSGQTLDLADSSEPLHFAVTVKN